MKRILFAALLALSLPAIAQSITWKIDTPAVCTVTCAPTGSPPPVPPLPPNPTPPVAPPAAGKPAPAGVVAGPDLTGTFGNPQLVYNIPAGVAVCYRYIGAGALTFTAAGQATDGTPPAVWVWVEGDRGYLTTPSRLGGQGTASVDATVAGEVRFCEQIDAPPGSAWNRYAQVNGAGVVTTTGGRVGTTNTGPPPR